MLGMDIREELKSAGVYPTGPVSAWPKERNTALTSDKVISKEEFEKARAVRASQVKASPARMATGLMRTAGQAMLHGKVSGEIREERYNTCKACPFFVEESKRCSDCGCFMEAKTWVGGDPDMLCPQKKWSR